MPGATESSTHAGTKLSISAALPASLTKTAYAALSYTEIGEVTDAGEVGRTYNLVDHQPLSTRGVQQRKGSFRDGTPTVQIAYAPGDPGQIMLETALDDDDYYSFKEELQNGSIIYYQALVTAFPVSGGNVDTIVMSPLTLAIKAGSIVKSHPA